MSYPPKPALLFPTAGSGASPCSKKMNLPPGFRIRPIPRMASPTPGIGLQGKDLANFHRVVEGEIHTRSNADFEDRSVRQRDDTLADLLNRFGITQQSHKMGIDAIFIEGHREISSSWIKQCPIAKLVSLSDHTRRP